MVINVVTVIKVKSRNALLRMLLVCMRSYLKSVLRYTFLILDTYDLDSLYSREQVCEDPWALFKAKWGLRAKTLGNTPRNPLHTNSCGWGGAKQAM